MIIRTGFISNSSSSSFVVKINEFFPGREKPDITKDEIDLLKKYGFKQTHTGTPSYIESLGGDIIEDVKGDYLAYFVICNQNQVIKFLIENNIPFIAACHYGHDFMIYKRNSDHIISIFNPGCYAETYGLEYLENKLKMLKQAYIEKYPIEEYLEEYEELE